MIPHSSNNGIQAPWEVLTAYIHTLEQTTKVHSTFNLGRQDTMNNQKWQCTATNRWLTENNTFHFNLCENASTTNVTSNEVRSPIAETTNAIAVVLENNFDDESPSYDSSLIGFDHTYLPWDSTDVLNKTHSLFYTEEDVNLDGFLHGFSLNYTELQEKLTNQQICTKAWVHVWGTVCQRSLILPWNVFLWLEVLLWVLYKVGCKC